VSLGQIAADTKMRKKMKNRRLHAVAAQLLPAVLYRWGQLTVILKNLPQPAMILQN
jgi:hypothetical protein